MLHCSLGGDTDPRTDGCRPGWPPSPYDQSQSGIIASISDAPFRLQVTEGQERETVEFLLDGNTEVERKLQIGSKATVEYRSVDGKNVALHVFVALPLA